MEDDEIAVLSTDDESTRDPPRLPPISRPQGSVRPDQPSISKQDLKIQRLEKKQAAAREKEMRRIEREARTATNGKAEQYLQCRVGAEALRSIDGLHSNLSTLMEQRKILTQLHIEEYLESEVEWWRKCIHPIVNHNGEVTRGETMVQEPVHALILQSSALSALIKSRSLDDFIVDTRMKSGASNSLLVLLSCGRLDVKDSEMFSVSLWLHSVHTQLRVVAGAGEAAAALCQLHRAVAKRREGEDSRIHGDVPKGQREKEGLVPDWWSSMLSTLPRLSPPMARAIAKAEPSPFRLMRRVEEEGEQAVVQQLSQIPLDGGRRLGVAAARKTVVMLCNEDGTAALT